jgi:hypothetical protein
MLQVVSPAAPNPAPPSGKLAKYTMPALRPTASTILSKLLTRDKARRIAVNIAKRSSLSSFMSNGFFLDLVRFQFFRLF